MSAAGARSITALGRISRRVDGEVCWDEPLAPKTSVRVGGPAELLVRPRSLDALVALLKMAAEEGTAVQVLGGGANTLVGDGGVRDITLKLPPDLSEESIAASDSGASLTLGAGAAISRLIVLMKAHGLVGAEFLAGIPGTLGGAATMNAGTKMGECMSIVSAVEWATPQGIGWVPRAKVRVEYRHTELPPGAVVTRVRFQLPRGDLAESQRKMDEDLSYRKRTQPLSLPNFGSVFKNPPGDKAGRLLESVGMKGHTIGRAQFSTVHANWIVNLGGATARDITALIALAQRRVRETAGIELCPEVRRVGIFL